MDNEIIVISGFSGAGKDTLAKAIHEIHGHHFVVSHTTRPMRQNESQGNPYYFVSDNEMCTMSINKELIEGRCYETTHGNWFYGVHKAQINKEFPYVVVLDIFGYLEFKKYFGNRVFGIFIDVPEKVRLERIQKDRPMELEEWNRRSLDDKSQSEKGIIESEYNYIVKNEDYNKTIKALSGIVLTIKSQRCVSC